MKKPSTEYLYLNLAIQDCHCKTHSLRACPLPKAVIPKTISPKGLPYEKKLIIYSNSTQSVVKGFNAQANIVPISEITIPIIKTGS